MCRYVHYKSARCQHDLTNRAICVEVCDEIAEAEGTPKYSCYKYGDCAEHTTYEVNNLCISCHIDNSSRAYLGPLDPRVTHMIEDGATYETDVWYVEHVSVKPKLAKQFLSFSWNETSKVSAANMDEEPVSPTTITPIIPIRSTSVKDAIMTAAGGFTFSRKRKEAPSPTPEVTQTECQEPNDCLTSLPTPPSTTPPPPPARSPLRPTPTVPPRHTNKLIITPLTGNIRLAPQQPLTLDATDPTLASTLERGLVAKESRQNLRNIRDSPKPACKKAKIVAETRVRLEEQGKCNAAGFKGGLRFSPPRNRTARPTAKKSDEDEEMTGQ